MSSFQDEIGSGFRALLEYPLPDAPHSTRRFAEEVVEQGDLERCLKGWVALDRLMPLSYDWVKHLPVESCTSPDACRELCTRIMQSVNTSVVSHPAVQRSARPLDNTSHVLVDRLCNPCLLFGKVRAQACAEDVWKMLPSIFDLEPWNDLRRVRSLSYLTCALLTVRPD